THDNKSILGGDAKTNANILYSVLNNEPSAYLDTVLLNAGLALFANGHSKTIIEGINEARQSIQTGAAMDKLTGLINYSDNKVEASLMTILDEIIEVKKEEVKKLQSRTFKT